MHPRADRDVRTPIERVKYCVEPVHAVRKICVGKEDHLPRTVQKPLSNRIAFALIFEVPDNTQSWIQNLQIF